VQARAYARSAALVWEDCLEDLERGVSSRVLAPLEEALAHKTAEVGRQHDMAVARRALSVLNDYRIAVRFSVLSQAEIVRFSVSSQADVVVEVMRSRLLCGPRGSVLHGSVGRSQR
jgi:hypothetical protein